MIRKALLLAFFGALFCSFPVQAFKLSPTKFYVTADPGTKQEISVKVTNTENGERKFNTYVTGMKQDAGGRPVFANNIDFAENWVRSDAAIITLKPNESKDVKFYLMVPADAQPGPHYLGLVVEESSLNSGGLGIFGKLAAPFTLQIAGTAREDIAVEKWIAEKQMFSSLPWFFKLKLRNNGTIDVLMKGEMKVRNWFGNIVSNSEVDLGGRLLAKSERDVDVRGPVALLWPGLYQVEVKVIYGRLGQSASAVENVIYMPLAGTLFLGIVVVCIIVLAIFLKRKLIKHVFRKK